MPTSTAIEVPRNSGKLLRLTSRRRGREVVTGLISAAPDRRGSALL